MCQPLSDYKTIRLQDYPTIQLPASRTKTPLLISLTNPHKADTLSLTVARVFLLDSK
jgi:hypothetical protein